MSVSQHAHHHTLFFFQKSLRNLFWASFLRQSGLSLVDIFTFIYIYRLGVVYHFFGSYSLAPFQEGMATVALYVIILRIGALIGVFPMAKIASAIGLPKAAIVGNLFMALRFGLLAFSGKVPSLIFLVALLQGFEIAVFSPAYDTMFARRSSVKHVGRDVGAFTFILRLTHALLPAFAATLIVGFGFPSAFIGAMVLLLLSNVPLLSMQWKERLVYPKPSLFLHWWKTQGNPIVFLALIGKYVNDVVVGLWPIYLLLIFGRIERLGLIMSLALFVSLLVSYFSGWYVDHTKKNMPFVLGAVLLALFWFGRINVVALQIILVLEICQKIVESFFNPSFEASVYRISRHLDTFAFYVYKELILSVVSLVFWSLLFLLFLYGQFSWSWLFVFAAGGILLSTMVYTTSAYGRR